jgi:DNA-binding winged helix-turn-helix (wHTH) protein/tetratricopeptide (TPR) repeat protein
MSQPSAVRRVIRFGTFEADLAARELRKGGVKLRLQGQPFQVLSVLLENPDGLVTREELRQELWPANTFVDFDNGLNTAINKIREALGDSAESPRFIETLPRRGYRFIAPVRDLSTAETSLPRERFRSVHKKIGWVGSAAAVVVLAAVGGYLSFHRAPKLTEKDSIVLSDFANTTGDPVFDGTLRQGLSVQLEQTPFLELISDDRIGQTLRLMERPPDTRLTPEAAREVCQRANATTDIEGSIAALGNQYVLGLNAVNCETGETLAREQVTAGGKEKVLAALTTAASELRSKLGESRASIERYDAPLDQDTTSSLEALRDLTRCDQEFNKSDWPTAISFCEEAASLDPNCALAYMGSAIAHSFMGERGIAAEEITKAYDLRDHASEEERFGISGAYYTLGTGDLVKAVQVQQLWTQTYPRDAHAYPQLAYSYRLLGRNDEALAAALESVKLDPTAAPAYTNIVLAYARQGHLDKARATLQDLETRHLNVSEYYSYLVDFLQNDPTAMAEHLARESDYSRFSFEASTAAYSGRVSDSRTLTERAIAAIPQGSQSEAAAVDKAEFSLWLAMFGDSIAARESAMNASKMTRPADWDVRGITALSLALAGETTKSRELASDLNQRFRENTFVQFSYLSAIRAALALHQGKPEEAIEGLRAASPYELGAPGNGTRMMPVYVRGEAYLAAHQGAEAATEFQKIVDNRGLVANDPVGALAQLGLGRAYNIQGDTARARAAYQNFLTIWKDADPNIPILKQANAEYAKLK